MVTVLVLHLPRSGPVQWLKDRQWSPVSGGVNGGGGKVVVWFILAVRGSIVDLEHNKATSYLTGLGPAPRLSVHLSWVQKILQASQRIWSDELRRNRQAKELAVASFPAQKQEWSDVTRVLTEGCWQACDFTVGGLHELSQICHKLRWPTHNGRTHTRVRDVLFKGPLLTSGGQMSELQ